MSVTCLARSDVRRWLSGLASRQIDGLAEVDLRSASASQAHLIPRTTPGSLSLSPPTTSTPCSLQHLSSSLASSLSRPRRSRRRRARLRRTPSSSPSARHTATSTPANCRQPYLWAAHRFLSLVRAGASRLCPYSTRARPGRMSRAASACARSWTRSSSAATVCSSTTRDKARPRRVPSSGPPRISWTRS